MHKQKYRITIVDDNQALVTTLIEFLNFAGFDVTGLYGIQDINQLTETKPDLVISDLQMPHLTGYEILELMKESAALSTVPVILITAMIIEDGQVPHASAVMRKPIDLKELNELLDRLLAERY